MVATNGMSPDGNGVNDTWAISNTSKFAGANFKVMKYIDSTHYDLVYDFTGTYTPWNAIGNVGAYNGVKVPSYELYFFRIQYNDGSGRVIGGYTLTSNNVLSVLYPSSGDIVTRNFSYSATSSALACASTSYEAFAFAYPITTAGGLLPPNATGGDYIINKAGYYRLQGTSGNWVRIDSAGYVMTDGLGNRIQGIC
jgi:hypothetical protein